MHVLIFAGGTVREGAAVTKALARGGLVIAADSGAETALERGYLPDFVVGDNDSLDAGARERLVLLGSQFVSAPVEKDETDTELAINQALEHGATQISLLGALGGERFEHSIGNILLLAGFADTPIELVDGPSRCWLLSGPGTAEIEGKKGDLLSLFPLAGLAEGVRTVELYYPLSGESLDFGKPRGISNVLLAESASVSLSAGTLLIVHTAV